MDIKLPTEQLRRGFQDIVVQYRVETKTALKAAIVLVLVLTWRDVLERGSKWLSGKIEQRWSSPVTGALGAAGLVTLLGVLVVYILSLD